MRILREHGQFIIAQVTPRHMALFERRDVGAHIHARAEADDVGVWAILVGWGDDAPVAYANTPEDAATQLTLALLAPAKSGA